MQPITVLDFSGTSKDGQIVIIASLTNKITLIGSSVPVSCRIGATVSYLTIRPEREGILAVRVFANNQRGSVGKFAETPTVDFLLNIKQIGEGIFYVDPSGQGLTKDCRLCQISEGVLEVMIDGVLFLSKAPRRNEDCPPFRVADGHILCQYVAGDIEADKVMAHASAIEAEKSALERLHELEEEKTSLLARIVALGGEVGEFLADQTI
jgi:hypothetical protein